MQSTSWDRAKEIFQDARELTPTSRSAFVDQACGGDDALRQSVATLLAADRDAGAFLSDPTQDASTPTLRVAPGDVFARLQQVVAGRYSLERELGRGGMGIVFLARDVALDRPVAIKLLPPQYSAVEEHRLRFLREARTAAGLSHPNIVPIHLVEERAELVYFVMAFVDGESLSQRVQRAGPLKPADAAKLVQEIAWALAYAHSNGVIHRDIKPDNVLIEKGSGRALVSDFGIARVVSSGTLSLRGEVMGTLRYMSPEQASGEADIDGRSDLYSLGVTAFYALTGRLPFEAKDPTTLLAMHLGHPAPPLRSVNPALPARLAESVDRCLAKDPGARFENGGALAAAIAETGVARREIAPSVREFLVSAQSGAVHLVALTMAWWAVSEALPRLVARTPMLGNPLDPLTALLGFLTLLAVLLPLHAARGVVRAGLDERDVAEAAVMTATMRDANTEFELARIDRLVQRLKHPIIRLGIVSLLGALAWFVYDLLARGKTIDPYAVGLFMVYPAFLGTLLLAPSRVVRSLARGTPEYAAMWRRIWSGAPARWFFRFAGIGLKGSAAPAVSSGSAPTEILLGRAAGALFDQLPAEQRKRLGDVHDVIRGLERAAASLRARQDELAKVAADVGSAGDSPRRARALADLETARAPLEQRMQSAVSALENLRLDLLRLRAGVGHAEELTLAIEEARTVREAVEIEIAAMREVSGTISGR